MSKDLRNEELELAEEMMEEHFSSMIEFIQESQKTALNLTELVLKYCKIDNLDEEKVFKTFSKSLKIATESFEKGIK